MFYVCMLPGSCCYRISGKHPNKDIGIGLEQNKIDGKRREQNICRYKYQIQERLDTTVGTTLREMENW